MSTRFKSVLLPPLGWGLKNSRLTDSALLVDSRACFGASCE